ncbi:flagellar motor switch protein FliN [Actinomarinicola tropica]|uniref:Flagellar motor switch protein FliN n=2 Tax=Actinomarinicola tropica TaxID=2789776 RepID=A0A5Q2RJM9_9ACTN|nr:flagellar motor switch protein FliN [Actinomarinicola tropica]
MVAAGVFAGVDHVATVGVAVHGEPSATSAEPEAMDLPAVSAGAPAPSAAAPATSRVPGGRGLDLLGGVQMSVVAELGRTRMTVAELLSLAPGSVVELDRAAGSPIDLLVNGTLIARGEVVVVDEEFGLRVTEIVDGTEGH